MLKVKRLWHSKNFKSLKRKVRIGMQTLASELPKYRESQRAILLSKTDYRLKIVKKP